LADDDDSSILSPAAFRPAERRSETEASVCPLATSLFPSLEALAVYLSEEEEVSGVE